MTQNVVTYTVEVDTENADGRMFPYFTANVQFEITHHNDSLLVPNSALRWFPTPDMVAPEVRQAVASKAKAGADPADPPKPKPDGKRRSTTQPATRGAHSVPHGRGTLWITDGKYVRPVKVRTGYTDGVNTEITGFVEKGTDLPPGTQVVVGEQRAQVADDGTTNPFAPKPMFGKKH